MQKIVLILVSLIISFAAYAKTDKATETKQYKTSYYQNGKLRYEGYFVGNKPVGLFKRYHQNGVLSCEQTFDGKNGSTAKIYGGDGLLIAEGQYIGHKRQSEWKFFTSQQTLHLVEKYENGLKQGEALYFSPSGDIMERVYYKDDKLDGERIKYFLYGNVLAKYNYANGLLNGKYVYYFEDGSINEKGYYKDNKRDSTWTFYEYDSPEVYTVEYKNGELVDKAKYDKDFQDKLDSYDVDPNLKDPEDYVNNPEGYFFDIPTEQK